MHSLHPALVALAAAALFHPQDAPEDKAPEGGVVTLYAHDDLLSSFSFRTGTAGGRLEEGEVRLTEAQIAFDVLAPGALSYGFVRDERVELVDLGEVRVPPQARARDRSPELRASLFHTLFTTGTAFYYVGPGGDVHSYDRADDVLVGTAREGTRHVQPQVGHVYVLRVRRPGVGLRDELTKFEVIDLEPGRTLTLRWAPVPVR